MNFIDKESWYRMKAKEWKIPYGRPAFPGELRAAGHGPLLSAVLALKGIESEEAARKLMYGGEECLHDPMLMKNMAQAVERLHRAMEKKEKVAVYGDYDVDGITSACLVADYLRTKGLDCRIYIPDRNEEGYGLNSAALELLSGEGTELIVTVDCGITALEEAELARRLGMDIIITDHHECKAGALPRAVAVIDCKQEGDNYPNKDLAGVGVAMKLVCACEGGGAALLSRYGDLVAVGTVADVMPLSGENRYLVRRGLKMLETGPRPGIAALLRECSIEPKRLNAGTVGFIIAPRLNAAGRLGQADIAAELLMCEDQAQASRLAARLCELNKERQDIETEIWRQASALIPPAAPDAPIVLAGEGWHQGVIGIAASRLAEQYSLPAIMICLNDGMGKGSCRSYGGFNLFEALSACSEHLLGFGGHALAAGLNIRGDKLEDFRAALTKYYLENHPEPQPEVQCDLLIRDPAMLSVESVRELEQLEPYGNGNPKPILCLNGVLLETAGDVGGGRHLRIRVRLGRLSIDGIFFSHTKKELELKEGELVDVAFSPQINEFHGHVSAQLLVSAIRKHRGEELCRRILEGDEGVLWAAASFCPERADFVRIWRQAGGSLSVAEDLEGVLAQCPEGMAQERFCLCLMTFLEAGLLSSGGGGIYGARSVQLESKADLEATGLIRALRTL